MNQKVDWAPVFGADTRKVEPVDLNALENVGVAFSAYGLSANQVITIDANPQLIRQEPRNERQNPTYLVAIKRDGVKNWLNPMSFLRTDSTGTPIYPAWYALGSAQEVVKALVRTGTLKCGENKTVKMNAFNRDGSAKMVAKREADGSLVLKGDGTPDMIRDTVDRQYPVIPDPKGE